MAAHFRWIDADAMLAGLRPGVLEEWQAYDRIEPFGDEQLTRLLMYLIASNGGEADWQTLRQRAPVDDTDLDGDAQTRRAISQAFGLQE